MLVIILGLFVYICMNIYMETQNLFARELVDNIVKNGLQEGRFCWYGIRLTDEGSDLVRYRVSSIGQSRGCIILQVLKSTGIEGNLS